MPEILKQTIRSVSPALYRFVRNRYRAQLPYNRLARRIGRRLNWIVDCGPFVGMRYLRSACCERILPKLLGSYEEELWPALRRLAALPIPAVVNVGCAEGYYAVGLARLFPGAVIHAFDSLAVARESTHRAAEANGVADRVRIAGTCDAATLATLPLRDALVVIDCEGAEFDILDPALAPDLAGSWLLVELHDFIDPRITPELNRRFAGTHEIEWIDMSRRMPSGFPAIADLSPAEQALALDEDRQFRGNRARQQWAFMRPRCSHLESA